MLSERSQTQKEKASDFLLFVVANIEYKNFNVHE